MDDLISNGATLADIPTDTEPSDMAMKDAQTKVQRELKKAEYEQLRNSLRQIQQQTWTSKLQVRISMTNALDKLAQSVQY